MLRDINLEVARGEVVVVVLGLSGSGKSTLCRTINRLEPIEGAVVHGNQFRSALHGASLLTDSGITGYSHGEEP